MRTRIFLGLAALLSSCVPPPHHPARPQTHIDERAPAPPLPEPPWRARDSDAAGSEPPRPDSPPVLLRGARLLLGDGRVVAKGHLLMKGGVIAAMGEGDGEAPPGARVVDGSGKVVTPGLIDTHSHLGVYPFPHAQAHNDGNEVSAPVTAGVRAIDGFWAQDPAIERAVRGGVTTLQALPGSANLIGGRAVTVKLRRALTAREMHFAGAPDGLKMACGENPKRVYGEKSRAPTTRMGNVAGQRAAFLSAKRLIEEWSEWQSGERKRRHEEDLADKKKRDERAACSPDDECKGGEERARSEPKPTPKRDLEAETLAGALEGRILVHVHCYRADDMASMMAVSDEMGFKIRSFHHALEAYKLRSELVKRDISVSTWADWWGFKMEAFDGIQENMALVELAGGRPIIHSDSSEGIRRLNQEAGKALFAGIHAGLAIEPARAVRWMTLNPAWALGVDTRVGTLDLGKDADVVVWSTDPFSVYAVADLVFIDGLERWNAKAPTAPSSDFEANP